MKHHSKFSSEQQQQQTNEQQTQKEAAQEFSTAEELLRYDHANTKVPPGISQRLQKSVGSATPPNRSWWRKLFGGD